MAAVESPRSLKDVAATYGKIESEIRLGGGAKAIDRQHEKGRLTARERVARLLDKPGEFLELGLWAAWEMYKEYGGAPAAGVVTGIGRVQGRECMIIANDATVKAGEFFPMTCKKIIRAQTIAQMARLPLIYLVDSAGVFLPLQEDVFPDVDDFGRIFRNNAVISAEGIPQIAAIMGYCVAGGGYLPVLCDTLLMTEGSGLYLAGPALVKAAIGQVVTDEELGGAEMHAAISGTIDFKEKDDEACIQRIRQLMEKYIPGDYGHAVRAVRRLWAAHRTEDGGAEVWEAELKGAVQRLLAADEAPLEVKQMVATELGRKYLENQLNAQVGWLVKEWACSRPDQIKSMFEAFGGNAASRRSRAVSPARGENSVYEVFTDKPGDQYEIGRAHV